MAFLFIPISKFNDQLCCLNRHLRPKSLPRQTDRCLEMPAAWLVQIWSGGTSANQSITICAQPLSASGKQQSLWIDSFKYKDIYYCPLFDFCQFTTLSKTQVKPSSYRSLQLFQTNSSRCNITIKHILHNGRHDETNYLLPRGQHWVRLW